MIERGSGRARLRAKVLAGAGGDDPGAIARDTSFERSDQEWLRLVESVDAAQLWTDTRRREAQGLDGSQWVLEGFRGGKYAVLDVWSPRRRGVFAQHRAAGERLLRRAGIIDMTLVQEY